MTPSLPDYPWQVVGTDFFELDKKHYLVVVDYFSHSPQVVKMSSTTSTCTVAALKNIIARYGIPEIVRSDDGPQYSCHEFAAFAKAYNFQQHNEQPLVPTEQWASKRNGTNFKEDAYQICNSLLNYPFPGVILTWLNF